MRITHQTRQMSFEDIQDKTKKRYIQILNRLNEPKTAKEIAVELFELGFIPSTERNYTAPRLTELEKMGFVKLEELGIDTSNYRIDINDLYQLDVDRCHQKKVDYNETREKTISNEVGKFSSYGRIEI